MKDLFRSVVLLLGVTWAAHASHAQPAEESIEVEVGRAVGELGEINSTERPCVPLEKSPLPVKKVAIEFRLDPEAGLKAEDLARAVAYAEGCWNQALSSAGAPFRMALAAKSVLELPVPSDFPGHHYQPALLANGDPIPGNAPGHKTSEFTVFLSKRIERSHVKSVWSRSIDRKKRMQALRAGKAAVECDRIYREELDPYQKGQRGEKLSEVLEALSAKHRAACDLSVKLSEEGPELPMGSQIYLNSERDRESLGFVLAHEIAHVWGGLADRYGGDPASRAKHAVNLMGRDEKCVLGGDQVKAILLYRRSGKQEASQWY